MPDKTDNDCPPAKASKHRLAFDVSWQEKFSWIRYVCDPANETNSEGMYCTLCQRHNKSSRRMVWIATPYTNYRRDKVTKHETSQCHMDAVPAESKAADAQISGGIRTALDQQVSMKRKAVIDVLK